MTTPQDTAPPPGLHFAPLHYLGEAFKILCWDDEAVRRSSKDNNSLVYGFLILAVATALPFVLLVMRDLSLGYPTPRSLIVSRYAQALLYSLVWIVLQIGLSHFLAKTLFDAKGSFVEIMRAYLLGQMFRWLIVVPIAGGFLTGVGGIAVLMLVFEEVDGIERMKAFGLAASIGAIFWIGSIWFATSAVQPIR